MRVTQSKEKAMTDSSASAEPRDIEPEGESSSEQPSTEADDIIEGKSGEPFAPNDERSS